MGEHENIRLTSAEMGSLWASYLTESACGTVMKYFKEKVEDHDTKEIVEWTLHLCEDNQSKIEQIFQAEDFPIPEAFGDEDVTVSAPRLYADTFFLYYLRHMAMYGLAANGYAATVSARKDVLEYYSSCIMQSKDLNYKATTLMLKKGVFVRPPYSTVPKQVDFVHDKSFLGQYFGDKRPLTGMEISHLYLNHQNNAMGVALLLGFAQTAKTEKVRRHFKRGVEIGHKATGVFASVLRSEYVPAPTSWDTDVMDSMEAPFSEKLMMFHVNMLSAASIGNYGGGMSLSMRRDLVALYARLAAETAQYAEDSAQIMIEHGWMEQPPQVDNRKELMRV